MGNVDDEHPVTPEVLAAVVAERFGEAHAEVIGPRLRQALCQQLETALRQAVRGQRRLDAELCRRRQQMWETTEARADTPDPLRAEARSRANEAAYLADLIETVEE